MDESKVFSDNTLCVIGCLEIIATLIAAYGIITSPPNIFTAVGFSLACFAMAFANLLMARKTK